MKYIQIHGLSPFPQFPRSGYVGPGEGSPLLPARSLRIDCSHSDYYELPSPPLYFLEQEMGAETLTGWRWSRSHA